MIERSVQLNASDTKSITGRGVNREVIVPSQRPVEINREMFRDYMKVCTPGLEEEIKKLETPDRVDF